MKKVTKTAKIPKPLNDCSLAIDKALLEKGSHKFRNGIYASDDVKQRLKKIYNNKCAFCETDTSAGAVLQVEHYRPKAKVTEDPTHDGYYWLGYEWSNLLYACSSCNRAKATFFPIEQKGVRVFYPPMLGSILNTAKCNSLELDLLNEKPLILNPEELDFEADKHFIISPNGGIRKISIRGDETINKCKLHRKSLTVARKKIVDEHLRFMMKAFEKRKNGEISNDNLLGRLEVEIERIIDRINNNEPYTLLAKYMLKHFNLFFVRRFQPAEQAILKSVYERVLKLLS